MRSPDEVTIVKLGGSHAFAPHLKDWLTALAGCGGRIVLVPGGGPFADAVRTAQPRMGFDARAAHHMALLAMEQFGCALASFGPPFVPAATEAAMRRLLARRKVPIWMASRMALSAADIPASWDVTSDSLAAWLAGRIGAKRVLLVKATEAAAAPMSALKLIAGGVVDPAFAGFLAASGVQASVTGPADPAGAGLALRQGMLPGSRIALP
jgi:aspartokinase-like uncharacterized kinase